MGEPTRTPFTFSKKITAGEITKKYAKGFLVGARPPFGGQAARLRLAFCAKMGSSEFKKSLQIVTLYENRLCDEAIFRCFDRLSGEVGKLYCNRVDDQAVVVGVATRYKLSCAGHDVESVTAAVDGEGAAHVDAIEGDGFGVCDAVGL